MDSPTVLCIDDRPQVLELRKVTLESHGYCVKIASSDTAMKMLEETSVAAVLLEYKDEGMDVEAVAEQNPQSEGQPVGATQFKTTETENPNQERGLEKHGVALKF